MINDIHPKEKLSRLIFLMGLSNEAFGELLHPNVSKNSIGKWRAGVCPPSKLSWRLKIEKLSMGQIKITDWDEFSYSYSEHKVTKAVKKNNHK